MAMSSPLWSGAWVQVVALLASLPLISGARRLVRSTGLSLLPYPADVKFGADGAKPLRLTPEAAVSLGEGLTEDAPAVAALRSWLAEVYDDGGDGGSIRVLLQGDAAPGSTAEQGYSLNVTDQAATLVAPTTEGLFYGVQTLKQLASQPDGAVATLPAVVISDAPRFVWRGLHLDVSRHFFTADNVKQLLETMSLYKLNRFHWHLTDDQGWRLPVDAYPKLTEIGGKGGAYTKKELKDVVAYAQARHIDVIPEIDVPGHVEAALAAYPDLGNSDIEGWQAPTGPRKEWGISDYTLAPSNATWTFLEEVFDTLAEVFSSKIVHMGGDEVRTGEWSRSNAAKQYLSLLEVGKSAGSGSETAVAKVFSGKVVDLLKARGRVAAAWDEAQHTGSFPDDGIVVAWNSADEAVTAVQAGRKTVVADIGVLYFDHAQSSADEPQNQGGCSSWQDVYNYGFMPASLQALPEEKRSLVLGAQGQLWSEYLPNWTHVEYMAHPRSLALAEKTWSPEAATKDATDFEGRMRKRLGDLDRLGVNYRKLGGSCFSTQE